MKPIQTLTTALFTTTATALQITSPTTDTKWDLTKENNNTNNIIRWTSVATDEPFFALKLVDKRTTPETILTIADNVTTAEGDYDVDSDLVVPSGPGDKYVVKAFSLGGVGVNTGLLAESGVFEIVRVGVNDTDTDTVSSTASASPSATETASAEPSSKTNAAVAVGGRSSAGAAGLAGMAGLVVAFVL